MRVWLAIDADGKAFLYDEKPEWVGTEWSNDGQWLFPFTGEGAIPDGMKPGDIREVELEIAEVVDTDSHAPRLPERATTRTGRTRQ